MDPELLAIYEKLGVPLNERAKLAGVERGAAEVAVDAVFDSVSVTTTFQKKLAEMGIIFCGFFGGGAEASGTGERSTWGRWCRTRTTSLRR